MIKLSKLIKLPILIGLVLAIYMAHIDANASSQIEQTLSKVCENYFDFSLRHLNPFTNKRYGFKVEEQSGGDRARFLSLPSSRFSRYLTGLDGSSSSFKRASSLDTLSGMMPIGKRSGAYPYEYINIEPLYSRQYPMRSFSRMYDMRWAPLDAPDSNESK